MLWGRAAGRCSKPQCRQSLYEEETGADDPALIGENCHMVAESDDGPRADTSMPIEQRNKYSNLILLCRNHHKVIDAQEKEYTIDKLRKMKAGHEIWVSQQLGFDEQKQHEDEQYAGIIEKWEQLAHVNEWQIWSSHVLSQGQPSMLKSVDDDLYKLRGWLLNRVWPGRYKELEWAFKNFRQILEDFQESFREHAEPFGSDALITRKFYKIQDWDEKRYSSLLQQYEFHVDLVDDLLVELSRAANLICDYVRKFIMRSYRLSEGRLVIQYGPTIGFGFHDVVVQYSERERLKLKPYIDLETFLTERQERDFHFGKGNRPA
jgi:hypothetical protein